jgi:cysteine desulfurase
VNSLGQVTLEQVLSALKANTVMVSLIHGNNEIGTLNPVESIGQALEGRGIVFHVDAAQSVGKTPIDVKTAGIGLLSLSAHKFYGPKGVGALYVRRTAGRVHLTPYLSGGGQERGLRGGTHNVPGIVGLGKAAELALELMPSETARLRRLRDRVINEVREKLGPARVDLNGHPTERLCNNINLSIHGVSSDSFLLGLRDIAFSSSSACSSGTASHVLQAIGQKTNDPLTSTIRLGLGRGTTDKDIEFAIERIACATQKS